MASIVASASCSLQSSLRGTSLNISDSTGCSQPSTAQLAVRCQHQERRNLPQASRRAVLASIAAISPAFITYRALALLEADEDDELLERVKRDRKSKIQKRESLGSYKSQAATIQKAVYKLGFTGEALDESDFAKASVVLGATLEVGWAKDTIEALNTVSSSTEEKSTAEEFSSSLEKLQAAVLKDDVEGSKQAFVASATSLEKFVNLTGLAGEIQGF